MQIRAILAADREALADLLQRTENFTADEIQVAQELIDDSIHRPESGYQTIVALAGDAVVGYLCYGRTPMTRRTFDLYWMAVDGARRGAGIGRRLVEDLERRVREGGGGLIRVETSTREGYDGTLAFYLRTGYQIASRLPDFYDTDDDLVTLTKVL
ncbi:MAG: hypothetical protein AMXMBFR64_46730 [Myxococcales bacterium]